MGPISPRKLPFPPHAASFDADYDVINEGQVSWSPHSPDHSTLPSEGRKGILSFSQRTPSPTFNKRSEKKGLFRNRSGSFDSHSNLKTRK